MTRNEDLLAEVDDVVVDNEGNIIASVNELIGDLFLDDYELIIEEPIVVPGYVSQNIDSKIKIYDINTIIDEAIERVDEDFVEEGIEYYVEGKNGNLYKVDSESDKKVEFDEITFDDFLTANFYTEDELNKYEDIENIVKDYVMLDVLKKLNFDHYKNNDAFLLSDLADIEMNKEYEKEKLIKNKVEKKFFEGKKMKAYENSEEYLASFSIPLIKRDKIIEVEEPAKKDWKNYFGIKKVKFMSIPELLGITALTALVSSVLPQYSNENFSNVQYGVSSVIGSKEKIVNFPTYSVDAITQAESVVVDFPKKTVESIVENKPKKISYEKTPCSSIGKNIKPNSGIFKKCMDYIFKPLN